VTGGVVRSGTPVLECLHAQTHTGGHMATRSKVLLATMFVLALTACSASEEFNGGGVIPSAQASDAARSLYPPLAADAEEDRAYDYQ
jgi:hypothetical protein